MTKQESHLPKVAFFHKLDTNEVIMDFKGNLKRTENLLPITPEQAAVIDRDSLWGPHGIDLYDGDDILEELERRKNNEKRNKFS